MPYSGEVGGSAPLRVQLCVYAVGANPVCGAETAIPPNGLVNWVAPPNNLPTFASGAYLKVSFPQDTVATFQQFIPVWVKPTFIWDLLKDFSAPFAGLSAYVDAAKAAFESGNFDAARRALDAVEREVGVLVQNRQLGPSQGVQLLRPLRANSKSDRASRAVTERQSKARRGSLRSGGYLLISHID